MGQNVSATVDFVLVLDAGSFGFGGGCPQDQHIVEERRQEILHVHLCHYQHYSSRFQLAVAVPYRTQ